MESEYLSASSFPVSSFGEVATSCPSPARSRGLSDGVSTNPLRPPFTVSGGRDPSAGRRDRVDVCRHGGYAAECSDPRRSVADLFRLDPSSSIVAGETLVAVGEARRQRSVSGGLPLAPIDVAKVGK